VRFFKAAGELLGKKSRKAQVDGEKYLYVWGRARYKNGFNRKRYINFCHRYPLEKMDPEPQGLGYSISAKFARHHEYGNNAN
jgi:hypothetical protein